MSQIPHSALDAPSKPHRRRLRATSMRVLIPLAVGVPGCFAAGWFELTRALGGREIAWVYTFEWPLYGIAGIYMWRRIWHPSSGPSPHARVTAGGPPEPPRPTTNPRSPAVDDPELLAWRQYLARLHAADPPGGPPPRANAADRPR